VVLVLEIMGLRLIARYVGITLDTSTAVTPVPDGSDGGDVVVVVASRSELPVAANGEAMRAHDVGWVPTTGRALDDFVGGAQVLTDDHAPVDQLLTPYGRP
jgi:hypothetical protein